MCSLSMNRISVITLFKIQIFLQISVVLAHIQVAFTACRAWIPFSMPCKWSLSFFFLSLKYYFRKKEHVLYLLYFNFAQLLWETASFSFIKDLVLSLSLSYAHICMSFWIPCLWWSLAFLHVWMCGSTLHLWEVDNCYGSTDIMQSILHSLSSVLSDMFSGSRLTVLRRVNHLLDAHFLWKYTNVNELKGLTCRCVWNSMNTGVHI